MVLRELLRDQTIAEARIHEDAANVDEHGFITQTKAEEMKENLEILREPGDGDSDDDDDDIDQSQKKPTVVVSFQVNGEKVENVKRQAIELDYPLMEEYDFRNDTMNPVRLSLRYCCNDLLLFWYCSGLVRQDQRGTQSAQKELL